MGVEKQKFVGELQLHLLSYKKFNFWIIFFTFAAQLLKNQVPN